jgi:hypothetical protein
MLHSAVTRKEIALFHLLEIHFIPSAAAGIVAFPRQQPKIFITFSASHAILRGFSPFFLISSLLPYLKRQVNAIKVSAYQ